MTKQFVEHLIGPHGHEMDVYFDSDTGGYRFIQDVGVPYEMVDTALTSEFELEMILNWLKLGPKEDFSSGECGNCGDKLFDNNSTLCSCDYT